MKKYYDESIDDVVYYVSDIVEAVSVKPLDGYKLLIDFSTGEKKIYDVSPLLGNAIYNELKNVAFFNSAKIEYGTVIWNDDIDLCPESLYNDSVLYDG